MLRSFAFTTQGRLHSKDIELFLMPTLLADTNLFLWVDLEKPTHEEAKFVLEDVFHFHPLSIEDCVMVSASPKVEEYAPKEEDRFAPYLFMVIHAVDYSRKDGVFATSELNFFLGKNFLVTFHEHPLRSVHFTEEQCLKGTVHIARAPDRVAHTLLDSIVENYKPALEELSIEIAELETQALEHSNRSTLNRILQIKKEVLHLRQIIGPQREVLARFARGEFKLIRAHLVPYYRDVYDRLFQISELAQGYMDSLTGIAAGLFEHVLQSHRRGGEAADDDHGDHDAADDDRDLVWHEFQGYARDPLEVRVSARGAGHLDFHRRHLLLLQKAGLVLVWPPNRVSWIGSLGASSAWTRMVCKRSSSAWPGSETSSKRFLTRLRMAFWSWTKPGESFTSTRRSACCSGCRRTRSRVQHLSRFLPELDWPEFRRHGRCRRAARRPP